MSDLPTTYDCARCVTTCRHTDEGTCVEQWTQRVREILRRDNVTEPGGDWAVYDVARELDPKTHKPAHLFDTGRDTQPRREYVEIAAGAIERIEPSARYVGGTSKYLYSLPKGV